MNKILGFNKEFRWLSNFYSCEVFMDGESYPSVEHAYQAAKVVDLSLRKVIKKGTASQAKLFGYRVKVISQWFDIREQVMEDLLKQKFTQEPFKSRLIATGDAYIEETNTWGDIFWGVYNGEGENKLGKMIMGIRNEIK